ncbi:hypothetical protein RB3333 [Rhodopirellula baltica SH 1]|uniref:Uncharacterized protein n=1 Tax=Rhodopirellula baltica (strain DSM 10527 / NCIMB 13988 / SH1) TaxID=243090 RepID=Q7UUE9_RHOBA|nr:hypothetical protein RB3333 [Rhodopirellula baltica SH 1]
MWLGIGRGHRSSSGANQAVLVTSSIPSNGATEWTHRSSV